MIKLFVLFLMTACVWAAEPVIDKYALTSEEKEQIRVNVVRYLISNNNFLDALVNDRAGSALSREKDARFAEWNAIAQKVREVHKPPTDCILDVIELKFSCPEKKEPPK